MPFRLTLVLTDYQKTKFKIKAIQIWGYARLEDNSMDILFLISGSVSEKWFRVN